MHLLAKALNILLHPLFMPLYTVALAMRVDPHLAFFLPVELRWIVIGMVALMTVGFPLTSTLLLLRTGLVRSLQMPERKERIAPYMMTAIYYGMAWYLLHRTPLHEAVFAIFIGAILALVFTTIVTLSWKISAHMVGIGGLIGALAGLTAVHSLPLLPVIAFAVLLAGALGTARLLTSDHTPAQVYTGAGVGFLCTYLCVVLNITF
jgi:hypothetical protein